MKKNFATNRGLIKTIVLVIAGLILFAYLGLNLRSIIESQTFIDNWNFIKDILATIWGDYLKVPLTYLYSEVFLPYIWSPAIDFIKSKF
jgi:ABC-type phosphate/phosphonate transport system permease subunit